MSRTDADGVEAITEARHRVAQRRGPARPRAGARAVLPPIVADPNMTTAKFVVGAFLSDSIALRVSVRPPRPRCIRCELIAAGRNPGARLHRWEPAGIIPSPALGQPEPRPRRPQWRRGSMSGRSSGASGIRSASATGRPAAVRRRRGPTTLAACVPCDVLAVGQRVGRAELRRWGLDWPPRRGWRARLLARPHTCTRQPKRSEASWY
jgi:hypothetical protein